MNIKKLIIDQIRARLGQADVKELFIYFELETKQCQCKVMQTNNESTTIHLEKKETMLINGIFISKVVKEAKKEFPDLKVKKVIVQVEMESEDLKLFLEFDNGELKPFNF
jgi:hypothetical protein